MHTDVSMSGKHSANRYIDNAVVVLLSTGRPPNSYPLSCLSPYNLSLMLLAINPAMQLFVYLTAVKIFLFFVFRVLVFSLNVIILVTCSGLITSSF